MNAATGAGDDFHDRSRAGRLGARSGANFPKALERALDKTDHQPNREQDNHYAYKLPHVCPSLVSREILMSLPLRVGAQ